MVKNHIKRLATPRTWNILRKTSRFITRPQPGAHSHHYALSLNTLLKEELHLARTTKEVKKILHDKACMVDGKVRYDEKFSVGLFDIITLPTLGKHYRVILDAKGKITAVEIKETEASKKIVALQKKTQNKGGKTHLGLSDGRTIIVEKDAYKVGDSLLIELPGQDIKEAYPFKEGMSTLIIKGKHAGAHGVIEKIEEEMITVKTTTGSFATKKGHAIITGEKKPVITCSP